VEVTRVSRGSLDARLALYDAGAGWRLTPTFSAGASLVVGTLDLETRTVGLLADPLQLTGPGSVDPRFGSPVPAPLMETRTSSSDTALAFSFGSWWMPAQSLGVAAVFRKGPRFDASSGMRDEVTGHRISGNTIVRLPDTAAIGAAWKPFLGHPSSTLQSLVLALDVERASDASVEGIVTPRRTIHTMADTVRRVSAVVDGETQARLGVEVRRSYPGWTLALRGGAYNERTPVVRREALAGDMPMAEMEAAALTKAGFLERPDMRFHLTAGAGIAFYTFSLDLGLDVSPDDTQASVSTTYRFGR
jgi:hypothetical protein